MQRRLLLLLPPHLPAEFIQRLDMPETFAGDGAKGQGAKEVHEKNFRDAELQSLLKGFQRPAAAPVVDGGQGIAGQGHHILYRDHIRVFAQQLFIVAVHLPQRVLRQLLGEPRHIVGAVPALRRRVEFRENRPLLQICFHILFSDFIAPGFLTRPLAGYPQRALDNSAAAKTPASVDSRCCQRNAPCPARSDAAPPHRKRKGCVP